MVSHPFHRMVEVPRLVNHRSIDSMRPAPTINEACGDELALQSDRCKCIAPAGCAGAKIFLIVIFCSVYLRSQALGHEPGWLPIDQPKLIARESRHNQT